MTTRVSSSYSPGGQIRLLGSADVYHLSDATQWSSGAGSYTLHGSQVTGVEVSGDVIRYTLSPPNVGLIYEQTDYDAGEHSAQGKLGASGALVIEAVAGSATAVLRGNATVVSNDATWYGEPRFNFYSAIVGAVVPFEVTYTLSSGSWTPQTFNGTFNYSGAGWVDFEHPVSVPEAVSLAIAGPAQVPDQFTTSYVARVTYENGVQRNVSAEAAWTVEPASLATVVGGVLTTGVLPTPQATLNLHASYTEGRNTVVADKQILCLADDPAERTDVWPMFQFNAKHTGYVPLALDPQQTFALRWQRNIGGTASLNPVAAGDGKVFVTLRTYFQDIPSLFAVRALDGQTLWSKGFGSINSVNPPSYAYGSVYLQTGNHSGDTWLRAYEADSGDPVFQVPHQAQWERYFAPTIHEGKVYVNGGYYGGMYAFDGYTGAQQWFTELPQYDQWTPAIDGGRAYSYVGEYTPGLYVKAAGSGAPAGFVADPNFEWNGWSMNLAPVVGGHDDVIAIHDNRLISFDTVAGTIRWEVPSQFTGQPSVAGDRIYAVNGGRLVVLDELTHGEIWSWQAPEGAVVGPMIVTDTHVLASTAQRVHAVDLLTHQSVWSYPASGHLALADGTLYVAGADGTLTAISAPTVVPSQLLSLQISGPAQVVESSGASYQAHAHYANGAAVERTFISDWSVEPDRFASFGDPGELTTGQLIDMTHDVVVKARYTELGQTVETTKAVRIVVAVPAKVLAKRNLRAAIELKNRVLIDLAAALELEEATRVVIGNEPPLVQAICREEDAQQQIAASLVDLGELVGIAGVPGAPVRPLKRAGPPCR